MKLLKTSLPGLDEIASKLEEASYQSVIVPLTHILTFQQGIVSTDLKAARVVPIFKAAKKVSIHNYRPI